MVKKIVRYCDITMEVIWLLALVSIPIYFNIYTSRVFEPDKITLFRTLVLILSVIWLVKWAAIWSADRSQKLSRRAAYLNRKDEIEPEYEPDGDIVPPDPRPFPRNFLLKPLVLPALALVFVYVMATVFSVVPGVSWWGSYQRLQGTYTLVSYVVFFLVIAFNLRERRQVERLISFNLLTLLPVALYGFMQHYKADPLPWQGDVVFRVTSSMGNAIFIAAYLIMVLPLVLYRIIMTGNWLVSNRHLAQRSFRGRDLNNALSWFALYGCFVIFEVGLFYVVLNFNASYRPDTSNLALQQAAAPQLVNSSQQAIDFNQSLAGDSGGPWWALPVGIALAFGLFFLFTVRRAGTDNNYLFRLGEFVGYLSLTVLTLLTLLYSQSRGPLLGILIALFFFAPILFWRRKMWKWLSGWLGVGLAGGAILLMFNLPVGSTPLEPIFKVARQNPEIARLGQFLEANDGTGKVRQLIWKTDFEIMGNAAKNEPLRLFIGYGPESLYNISPPFYQPELARVEARNAIPDRSHNGYLDALVMTGGIGLLAYLAVVITFFFYAFKFLRRTNRLDYQVLLASLIAVMLAHQIEIQTGIQIVASWMLFWMACALVVVVGGLVTGGYGRAYATAPQSVPAVPEPVAVEEPELEPVAVAATNGSKSNRTGKKARNGQAQPAIATAEKVVAQSAAQPKTPPAKTKAPSGNSKIQNPKSPVPSRGKIQPQSSLSGRNPKSGRLTPAGAFGLGGGYNYATLDFTRPVRPWFWAIAGVAGVIALAYAYFANYLPIAADAYYKQGSNLGASQHWDLATPYFQEAINFAPTEDFYYLFLGQAYLEQARALSADPSQLQARHAQITDLFTKGEQTLKKAHELAPLNPDHYANLARLYALWAAADPNRSLELMAKSIDWYEQVTSTRAPRNARIWAEMAAAYLNMGLARGNDQTYVNKAIAAGEQSVKLDDRYDFNRIVLGDIYLAVKQPEKAGPNYLVLAQIDPQQLGTDTKYNERVQAMGISPQVSIAEVAKALAPGTDTKDLSFRDTTLGGVYYYKGMYSEAEGKLNAGINADKTNPYAPAYLALVRAKQNRTTEAQTLAVDAVELARKVQDNSQTLNLIQQMLTSILIQK